MTDGSLKALAKIYRIRKSQTFLQISDIRAAKLFQAISFACRSAFRGAHHCRTLISDNDHLAFTTETKIFTDFHHQGFAFFSANRCISIAEGRHNRHNSRPKSAAGIVAEATAADNNTNSPLQHTPSANALLPIIIRVLSAAHSASCSLRKIVHQE
jgi:hypothetical protein